MQQYCDIEFMRRFHAYVITYQAKNRATYYFFKRLLDIVGAATILILLLPIILMIAILIRIDSPGPVFFIQNRVGAKRVTKNGNLFWQKTIFPCIKFRTMIHNADCNLHKSFVKALMNNDEVEMAKIQKGECKVKKLANDPRVTKVGWYLRRSSLDEISQLINVLNGEMSLVGPRPAIPYEVEMYKPYYYHRLDAKAGLTGLWQVTARSSADYDEMVKLDIQYVDNQSFWLDLKILLKTPIVVISRKGAV
jgi:lipopolysaccharide/colanic/teichoic acid biosynthesis glycosyltransferase